MTGPTAALPGTTEKVAVLTARAAARLPLFDPLDAVRDDAVSMTLAVVSRLRQAPPPRVRKVWVQDVGQEDAA